MSRCVCDVCIAPARNLGVSLNPDKWVAGPCHFCGSMQDPGGNAMHYMADQQTVDIIQKSRNENYGYAVTLLRSAVAGTPEWKATAADFIHKLDGRDG